jgi:hypothetical protein
LASGKSFADAEVVKSVDGSRLFELVSVATNKFQFGFGRGFFDCPQVNSRKCASRVVREDERLATVPVVYVIIASRLYLPSGRYRNR